MTEQSEDHYRRSTFRLYGQEKDEIGSVELSISFIQTLKDTPQLGSGLLQPDSFLNSHKRKVSINESDWE